jgi:serine/threonine-protein kinase RsbW
MEKATSLRVRAELDNLKRIRRFVDQTARAFGCDPEAIGDMILALNEAVTNIIVHGYQNQPGLIEVEVKQQQGDLTVCLRDQAAPFDPTRVATPDIDAPLSQRPFGGMGVHIMRSFTDELTYRATPEGDNELTLVKRAKARK